MVFVRGTFRVVFNVHSLNTEGAVGNYNPLVRVFVTGRNKDTWEVVETYAISGNMLKHWHARIISEIAKAKNLKSLPLCEDCIRGVFYRTRLRVESESDMISKCVLDDLHGFLCTETQVRRESLIKLSFAVPVEERIFNICSVTHNRVVVDESGKISKEGMMPFKNEYASGIYAFAIAMDLKYVGIPLANPNKNVINNSDRKDRAKIALEALGSLLQGEIGAKQARAFPIAKPLQALVIISKYPIPAPTHAYYKDYIEDTMETYRGLITNGLLGKDTIEIHTYGIKNIDISKELKNIIKQHNSIGEMIGDLSKKIDEWLE